MLCGSSTLPLPVLLSGRNPHLGLVVDLIPVSGREEYLHKLSGALLRGYFVSFPSFVYPIISPWYGLLETDFYSSYSFKAIFPGSAGEVTDAHTVLCASEARRSWLSKEERRHRPRGGDSCVTR